MLERAQHGPDERELEHRIERHEKLWIFHEPEVPRRSELEADVDDEHRAEESARRGKICGTAPMQRDLDEGEDQSQHWAGSAGMDRDNSAGAAAAEDER